MSKTAKQDLTPTTHVDWLLAQFGRTKSSARKAYKDFVHKDEGAGLWSQLNGPDVLGDDDFRNQLQQLNKEESTDIPKRKRLLRHLPLDEVAEGRGRAEWIREAYMEHGYTMQSIAEYANLHHSTVSRLIKEGDKNARNKT